MLSISLLLNLGKKLTLIFSNKARNKFNLKKKLDLCIRTIKKLKQHKQGRKKFYHFFILSSWICYARQL